MDGSIESSHLRLLLTIHQKENSSGEENPMIQFLGSTGPHGKERW